MDNFWNGFEKRAAPKWVKMFRTGKLNMDSLSKITKGMDKERLISPLGVGREGVADLVSYPGSPTGIATRKIFDPNAPGFSQESMLIRAAMQRVLGEAFPKHMTKLYGVHPSKPIIYREYIPPRVKEVRKRRLEKAAMMGLGMRFNFEPENNSGIKDEVLDKMNEVLEKLKLPKMIDVHKGNVMKVKRTPKIIDFLPEHMESFVSKIQKHKVPKNLRALVFKR